MIMDEFNDWFIDASTTVNDCITKLMQKARAAGIHIILATQRPSADVIKGAIKANITARFAFSVSSFADSSVILGQSAAEKLEGKGDMILRFPGRADMRLQGAFVSNKEIKSVVEYLRTNYEVDYIVTLEELQQSSVSRGPGNGSYDPNLGRNDELFKEICYIVVRSGNASVNSLQKAKGTSFNRMDRIFRDMEELGIVSSAQQGTKRRVLVTELELEDILNKL
jgi:S-DNA-T family DNA segregation ATPase FtsK/SpoIIIE